MKSYENKPEETTTTPSEEKAGMPAEVQSPAPAEPAEVDAEAAAVQDEVSETSEEESSEDRPDASYVEVAEGDIPSEELPPDEAEAQKPRRRFTPPSREQIWTAVVFWGIILLGGILRFWGLGDKPLHHDESQHAYFSLQLMHNMENWLACAKTPGSCYVYNPLLHGPFQFHAIALVYKIAEILGVPGDGANNYTARIAAATLGTGIVALPYFLRHRLGNIAAWLSCFLLAISPSLVYYSRFTREDIYMAFFTLLLVVGAACYLSTRKAGWLIVAALGLSLSYATKEATFLTIAIFGSFFGALLLWELGIRWRIVAADRSQQSPPARLLPRTAAPLFVVIYFLILAAVAKWFFGLIKGLSIFITANQQNMAIADQYVAHLKQVTVATIPWLGILLAILVFFLLWREQSGKLPTGRRGLAKLIDPGKQPLLDTIITMPWTHWFFALICGWAVFLVLFTVLFTNIGNGIGDGIWQGLYYWLQQQQVARGGQPWYYYLLLIPLYEQIGLVFGLVGVVRCLLRPTRFRLFLVWWFAGSFLIYSWAGEKMPWLTIHITMPMMLLAAIGLEPVLKTLLALFRQWFARPTVSVASAQPVEPLAPRPRVRPFAAGSAIFGALMALALLAPTLQNMYQLSYVHAADAPHEMMIYVQTTTSVNTVMAKIDQLDKAFYGGQHRIPVALLYNSALPDDTALWPFAWYLRNYPNTCYKFPLDCPQLAASAPVIIAAGSELPDAFSRYSGNYLYHQYPMRSQWDQGYMMPPCKPTPTNPCTTPQPYVGVGPLLWLSYGDNPPPNATFNAGLAAQNIWQWWWQRKAIGSTNGSYDMGLFIRKDLGVTP